MHIYQHRIQVEGISACNKRVRGLVHQAEVFRRAGKADLALECLRIAQWWEDRAVYLAALQSGQDEGQVQRRLWGAG